jgi:ketosteroid isomerase-like protein
VKSILKKAYVNLNSGNVGPVLAAFHPQALHHFGGRHALAGTRNSAESRQRWYARLHAVFPDIKFEIHEIAVSGTPWNTCARVTWTERNSGTDGVRTSNEGINVFTLKWGKVTDLKIFTDTVRLAATLDRLAKSGNTEASAEPIVDPPFSI